MSGNQSLWHAASDGIPEGVQPTEERVGDLRPSGAERSEMRLDRRRYLRYPLYVSLVGLIGSAVTGLCIVYATHRYGLQVQTQQLEEATRNSALTAVSDIADLVSERRQRGVMLSRAIEQGLPPTQIDVDWRAYEEAFVRYNTKMPGDVLRVKAQLGSAYKDDYQKYIDGLVNADVLETGINSAVTPDGQPRIGRPGLFKVMHDCLTEEIKAYWKAGSSHPATAPSGCNVELLAQKLVLCFAEVSGALYRRVTIVHMTPADDSNATSFGDSDVIKRCRPPS